MSTWLYFWIIIIEIFDINKLECTNYTNNQWWGPFYFCSGASLIMSSILRIVIAASVANRIELILEIMGSSTPAFKLFLGFPFNRSNPQYFKSDFLGSLLPSFWDAVWRALSFEISYVASLAAFVANVFGITFKASLNSDIAICYLLLYWRQNWSRWMLKATSTAPPPATTWPDSRVLFATQIESWRDLKLK